MTPVINARSGKYAFRFIVEDGRCGASNAAITAAHKLLEIERAPFMFVGCSGEILQTAQLFNSKKALTLSLFGSHPDVKRIGGYVFRTYPDTDTGVEGLFRVVQTRGYKRVAVITEEASFTKGRRRLMETLLKDRLVVNESFRADDQDFRGIITKVKSANAEALYLNVASPSSHQSLLKQVRQFGVGATLLANEPAADSGSVANLGALQDGIIFISAAVSKSRTAHFVQIMQSYHQQYQSNGEFPTIVHSTYNAITALTSVVENSGLNADEVKGDLLSWRGTGATGEIKFDSNQGLIGSAFELQMIRDGKPTSDVGLLSSDQ